MTPQASQALHHETEFLSGVDANFEAAKGKLLRGSIWRRAHHDDIDRLKALLAKNRIYDREKLKSLPANRRVALHGFDRRLVFGKKSTGVAIASTLAPLSHYVQSDEGEAPPAGLGELLDHVRKLVTDRNVPYVIGVCSPTGFTPEALEAKIEMPNVSLVLVAPDGSGGWRVTPTGEGVDLRVTELFDPETNTEKIDRVRSVIEERSADLLTGGLVASSMAADMNISEYLVRRAFERETVRDPELRVTKKEGQCMLYRGAEPRQEKKPMNVIDRIKQLFSGDGDDAEKINALAEHRATLAQRRDRLYADVAKLEAKEAELLDQGKSTTSQVTRKRLAARLAQLRKDIGRFHTTAAMLDQQINIVSTNIHNLKLIEEGEAAQLPDATELTENAVKAEEILETLKADSDLVDGLETGMGELMADEEELAILKEFEGDDVVEPPAVSSPPQSAGPAAKPATEASQPAEPDSSAPQASGADPEAT